jgi:hypothetical protein
MAVSHLVSRPAWAYAIAAPGGPALIFNRQEWAAFVTGVKGGQADFALD